MKKNPNMLKSNFLIFTLILAAFFFSSCDDDFTETGAGLINSIDLPPLMEIDEVISYTESIGAVKANNVSNFYIGDFSDPVFGKRNYAILSQLELSRTNPDFDGFVELDSAILSLPLYSRLVAENEFAIDSVVGDANTNFVVKVFKSNQFLRNVDPGPDGEFDQFQLYFNNQLNDFLPNIETTPIAVSESLNLEELSQQQFLLEQENDSITEETPINPQIRIKIPNEFIQEQIIDKAGGPELVSNSAFKNYFRGLFFQLESSEGDVLLGLNMNSEDAGIRIFYKTEVELPPNPETGSGEESEILEDELDLLIEGISLGLTNDENDLSLSEQDTINGEETTYLRGGAGFATVVELFTGEDSNGDGVSDQLEDLRNRDIMVNEANLIFYVDEEIAPSNSNRPRRIMIYDIDNNEVFADYNNDPTFSEASSVSLVSHLGPLSEDEEGNLFYRIRITDYLNELINENRDSVKIGVVVSDNVNQTSALEVKDTQLELFDEILSSSAGSIRGTVLHGSNSPNEQKKLKLQIQLTELTN